MLLSSSSTLVGIHVFPLTIGIAMTFNKPNIMASDIGYADTKGVAVVGGGNFAVDRDCGCGG
jgi:hypothetical protein